MSRRRNPSALHPPGPMLLANGNHLLQAVPKVVPLFNDGPPGGPHRGPLRQGQNVVKGPHILPVQLGVQRPFHVVRRGGPLGVHIEHDKGVKSIPQGDPLHALEGRVQCPGPGGRGVDADADQGIFSPGAQNISVLCVGVRHKQPLIHVVFFIWLQGQPKLPVKADVPQGAYVHGRYVLHSFSLSL